MKSDEEIIGLYFERSENAITHSRDKYGSYCHTIAWRILYDEQDSEECVSDTWLQAWKAIPPQRPQILKAFFGKITRNLALNRYEADHAAKRGGGQTSACIDELEECIPDSGQNPESAADRLVLTKCLNAFLETLGADDRRFFVQRYWYSMSVDEIAKDNDAGKSRVKMSLMRSRNKLKQMLEKEGMSV